MPIVLILALAALAASATPALADPVSLVIAGVNALFSVSLAATTVIPGAFGLTVGGLVGTVLAVGGSVLASVFSRPGRPRQAPIEPGNLRGTFETSAAGVIRCVGRARIGGVKFFGNTSGVYRTRVIGHCRGPIDGVEQHFFGGREVTVEANGDIASPPYARPGGSYINVVSKIGDGAETDWGFLLTLFPDLWTADHRVRGIAQSLITYISPGLDSTAGQEKFQKLFQSGAPDYERIQRGELIYDPRSGLTAWSDNGVLVVLHAMLGYPEFDISEFDLDFIADEADRADEPVAVRGGGTEPRSRAWGLWDDAEINRGDLLAQMLLSTGTEIVPRPGDRLGIRLIDDARLSELTIPARHIVELTLKAGPEGVERPNRCRVRYYSPQRNYEMSEINLVVDPDDPAAEPLAWSVAQAEIDRVGEREVTYDLPFCPSAAQAQRIARRLFATARADSGIAQTNMVGLACFGLRSVSFEVPDLDTTLLCEISPARVDDAAGRVEIPFVVAPVLAAWNPEIDEAVPPDTIPDLGYESQMPRPDAPSAALVVTYPDTSKATRIAYTVPAGTDEDDTTTIVEAVYRDVSGVNPGPWTSMTEFTAPGGYEHAFNAVDLTGVACEFRIRTFNADEDASNWSELLEVAPSIDNTAPTGPSLSFTTTAEGTGDDEILTGHFTLTAPSQLRVAALVTTGLDAPGTIPTKPGEVFTWSAELPPREETEQAFDWTAQALSSNGTGSGVTTVTITVPPLSPP